MAPTWTIKNRVRETLTSHTGTGTFQLEGTASTGYQRFNAEMSDGDKCIYVAESSDGSEWEIGVGTYVAATDDLQRTTVRESTNADAAVNFSAGTIEVWLDVDATWLLAPEVNTIGVGNTLSGEELLRLYAADDTYDYQLRIEQSNANLGDAAIYFSVGTASDYIVGIDNSDADCFVLSVASSQLGTANVMRIDSTGGPTIELAPNVMIGADANGSSPTATTNLTVWDNDTSTTPGLLIDQQGSGDAAMQFALMSKQFSIGIDNSTTSDDFVLSESTSLGTTNRWMIDGSSGVCWFGGLIIGNSVTASDGVDDQLIVEKNNASTTTPQVIIDNQGTGDTLLQWKGASRNWYVGIDNSDTNDPMVFSVSAPLDATSANSPLTLYYSGTGARINSSLGIGKKFGNSQLLAYANTTQTYGILELEQEGTGDCAIAFLLTGAQRILIGIDNSDADSLVIADSTALGTTNRLRIDGSTGEVKVYKTLGTNGEVDNGNSSTADTIDWRDGNHQKSTLTGNCTYTFTAPSGVGTASLVLKLIQDATGSRTVTWPAAVKWAGGTAPTLTTTNNAVDIICFYWDGTSYHGSAAVLDSQ